MGGTFRPTLLATRNPKKLVPGDPQAVQQTADRMSVFGDALLEAGEGLKRISTEDGWRGKAADQFRDAFDGEPKRWIRCGDAFHEAAKALGDYATTLAWAQGQAAEAADTWERGQDATKQAKAEHETKKEAAAAAGLPTNIPFSDPGEELRAKATDMLNRARNQLNEAGDRANRTVSAARDKAPEKPNFFQKAGDFLEDVGDGLADIGRSAINGLASVGNAMINNPGDVAAAAAGLGLMAVSSAGVGGGIAISATGGGAVAGAPLTAVSAAGMAAGAAITGVAAADIMYHATGDSRVEPLGENSKGTGARVHDEWKQLGKGRQEHVRTVKNEDELRGLYDRWAKGGREDNRPSYNGKAVEHADGTRVGIRETSSPKSGNKPTVDVKLPDGTNLKVHF